MLAVTALAATGLAQAKPEPAAEAARLVELGRQALAAERLAEASAHYRAALALDAPWSAPVARIGLASIGRIEGRLPEAAQELARAREVVAGWPMDHAYVQQVRQDLEVESFRCNLALGLDDQAELALEAAASAQKRSNLAARTALDLSWVDLHLARGDLRRARRTLDEVTQRLAAAKSAAAEERAVLLAHRRNAELRDRLLRLQSTADPQALTEVAVDLGWSFARATPGSPAWTRSGLDTVRAWDVAGDLDLALAASRRLNRPPFESLQRQAEIQAQYTGLLLRQAATDPAALAAAQATLAELAAALFADWRQQPLRAGGSGVLYFPARREILGTLLGAVRRVHPDQPERALGHLEAALSVGTLTRRLAAGSAGAPSRALVPTGGGALVFALAPTVAHLVLVDARGVAHVEVPLEPSHQAALRQVRQAIERRPEGDVAAAATELAQVTAELGALLLPPAVVTRLRGWSQVVLVGDEAWVACLQALPCGAAPLGVQKPVSHLPSWTLWAALAARSAARSAPRPGAPALALVADPTVGAAATGKWGVGDLELSREQIHALQGGHAAGAVVAALHDAATAAALRTAAATAARQLTIIAHGVEDFRFERSAGVVLAPTAGEAVMLRGDQVEPMEVPPLVALGVCGAAAGPRRFGDDGVHHLGGAFVIAGADRVVLAGGQLAVGACVDLLAEFTSGVRQGRGPAEALRQARATVHAAPGRQHPFFWAGLRLLGLPDPPAPH